MLQDKAVARRFASETVQKTAFLTGTASDAQGEGHDRDHAANAGYLLGSQAASSTLFTSTKHSSKEKKKKKTPHMRRSAFLRRM